MIEPNDQDLIDNINPFVQHDFFMPGGVRQPHDFGAYKQPTEEESQLDKKYVSPMCDYGITVAGRIGKKGPCKLSRPLYPGRNIQYDDDLVVKSNPGHNNPGNNTTLVNVAGALSLILLIAAL